MCGSEWFEASFKIIDPNVNIIWEKEEGSLIEANTEVATIEGNSKCMVASERTGLNFLQMMSGIAYKTYCYQKKLEGSNTKLLDTRKTTPGLRIFEKYAVTVGGGYNHRMDLEVGSMFKDNHLILSNKLFCQAYPFLARIVIFFGILITFFIFSITTKGSSFETTTKDCFSFS